MSIHLDLQNASEETEIPAEKDFNTWVNAALRDQNAQGELTIRIVDEAESATLNNQYRQKNKATNVLSFPYDVAGLMGDIVICAPIVIAEAKEQAKSTQSHWAHLVIHGCLHLMGYDHMKDDEASQMEALEKAIMEEIGYKNPYEEI